MSLISYWSVADCFSVCVFPQKAHLLAPSGIRDQEQDLQCVSFSNLIIGLESLFLWVKIQINQRMMIMIEIAIKVKLNRVDTVLVRSIPR